MDKQGKFGRRLVAVVLAVLMVSGGVGMLGTVPAVAAQTGDDGTTNWDFIVPVTHKKTVPSGYIGIYNANDLNNIRNNLSSKYILMNGIDLASWGNWEPIGNNSASFSGIFDGNGYVIKNMTAIVEHELAAYAGLFSHVYNGTIENLALRGCYVSASSHFVAHAGGLTSRIEESVVGNCFVTGNINAILDNAIESTGSYYSKAGGLTGESMNSFISNCYNLGSVDASSPSTTASSYTAVAGGVAGWVDQTTSTSTSNLTFCFNAGKVSASAKSPLAGGIAGTIAARATATYCRNDGNINAASYAPSGGHISLGGISGNVTYSASVSNSFNKGSIQAIADASYNGSIYAGGITGYLSSSELAYCYSIGEIVAPNANPFYVGGIAGQAYSNAAKVSDSYYLNTTAANPFGQTTALISNVLPLTDTQMRQQASFVGFDFTNVWQMPAGGGYPVLRGMPDGGTDPNPTTYTINYNANCPNPADVSNMPTPQIKTQGQPLALSDKIPARTDYKFKGWASSSAATVAQYQPGGSYTTDANVTLYAVWGKTLLGSVSVTLPVYNLDNAKKSVAVPWDNRMFEQPATEFSHDIAKLAMAVSAAAYDRTCIEKAISDMGFTQWESFNYNDNFNAYTLAKKKINVNGVEKNLVLVALRGTGGSATEWYSNIVNIINIPTGTHLGFTVYADEVLRKLESYVSNPSEDKILITGHSRGAGAANIIGEALQNKQLTAKENTYVYTYATPNTTVNPNYVGHNNIYNFVNAEDIVPDVPPLYGKSGTTYVFHRNDFPLMKTAFSELTNGKNMDVVMDATTLNVDGGLTIKRKIEYSHAWEVYLSFVIAYAEQGNSLKDVYNVKRSIIACPVDVEVYNEAGVLVGKVVNNIVEVMTGHVKILVDGDVKYIYTPTQEKYRLELLATATGQMNYKVEDFDLAKQTASSQKNFRSVALEAGKRMTSTIGGDIAVPNVRLYVTDSSGTIQKEVQTDGTETTPSILTITNAPSAPLQYKSSVTLAASEAVTWSSASEMVSVNPTTGKVESVSIFGFAKSGEAKIIATSLDGQRTASATIQIQPAWWQWIIIIVLFGWIWY